MTHKIWIGARPAIREPRRNYSVRIECIDTPLTYGQALALFALDGGGANMFVRCRTGPKGGKRNPEFNNEAGWPVTWQPGGHAYYLITSIYGELRR